MPRIAASGTQLKSGESFPAGIAFSRPPMIPDFGTPLGKRLVYRSVQVSQSSIAANGIPCDGAEPGLAAAVRDAPGADVEVVDVGPRRELGLERAEVGDLAGTGDRDEAAGVAVAADVVGQDGVSLVDEVGLGAGVHAEPVAAEAVEHDHAGPAGGRLRAVREVERRGELRRRRPSSPSRPAW